MKNIPKEIKTPIYYAIVDGNIKIDVESMEDEFDRKVQAIIEKYADKDDYECEFSSTYSCGNCEGCIRRDEKGGVEK